MKNRLILVILATGTGVGITSMDGKVPLLRDDQIVSEAIAGILEGVVDIYRIASRDLSQLEREVLKVDLLIGLDTMLEMVDAGCVNRITSLQ